MANLNSNIQKEINKLQNDSAYVEFFKVDGTAFGGPVVYFTNNPLPDGGGPTFNGITYQPLPVEVTGFDTTASGTMAKPTLTVGNVGKVFQASLLKYGDMVGWKFSRIRTYEKFCAHGATPNGAACIGPEEWLIEKLVQRSSTGISWQLTSKLDRMGFRVGRQILKDQSVKNIYAPGVSRTRTRT